MRRFLTYALFGLSGMSALVYEVLWMRWFTLLFGSSTRAVAAVLAAFFAALAVGHVIGGRLSGRPSPLRTFGWAEIAVGFTALLVGPFILAYTGCYPWIYEALHTTPGFLSASRVLLTFLAIGLPAVAMGVTLPVMAKAVTPRLDHVARRTGGIYAVNVAGAVVGAMLAGFVLPAAVGTRNGLLLAAATSVFTGLCALRLARSTSTLPIPTETPEQLTPTSGDRRPAKRLLVIAGISGFGTLALEVYYTRILIHYTDSSVYAFGFLFTTYLLALALGAAATALWMDRRRAWSFLAWTQLLTVCSLLVSPFLYRLVPYLVTGGRSGGSHLEYVLVTNVATIIVLGPAVFFMGMVLPATWKIAVGDVALVGRSIGRLTAVNTLAGVAGSLCVGFLFLPLLGSKGCMLIILGLYACVVMLASAGGVGLRRWVPAVLCVGGFAWAISADHWDFNMRRLKEGEKLVRFQQGESVSVIVAQTPDGHRDLRTNNNYLLGSSQAFPIEVRQGRLPLLLHPQPRSAAFIGVATGMTVSGALDFPLERIVAIELLPEIADAARDFDRWNRSVLDDPRVELVIEDGRNHLLGSRDTYDVIVSDLFVPWQAGTGYLYTVEHFRTVHDRLAAGGLFCQWLPGYQLTEEELRTIAASFVSVFPHAALWRAAFESNYPVFGLIGYPSGLDISADAVRRNCARLAKTPGPPAMFLSDPVGVELLYVCGPDRLREWTSGALLNTDDRPWIEYHTPRSLPIHRQKYPDPLMKLIASWRPRQWGYAERPSAVLPLRQVFSGANALHDAVRAAARHNFELEYRNLEEALEKVGRVPGVAAHAIEVAVRYRSRNMLERSRLLLTSITEGGIPSPAALIMLADMQSRDGNNEAAINLLERALELAPRSHAARGNLVRISRENNRFDVAARHLKVLLESFPDDAFMHVDLAEALHKLGQDTEARGEVDWLKTVRDADLRSRAYRYLRTRDLGDFLDNGMADPSATQPSTLPAAPTVGDRTPTG